MPVKDKKKEPVRGLVSGALCLALCIVLPFVTGQIPEIGNALCPMHLPVLIAGFVCGPWWAAGAGFIAPLLRNMMFGMPQMPGAVPMSFEIAAYGMISGMLWRMLPKKTGSIYIALIAAMLGGRIVWGLIWLAMSITAGLPFSRAIFISGAFTTAIPGIIVQLILVPVLVSALRKTKLMNI